MGRKGKEGDENLTLLCFCFSHFIFSFSYQSPFFLFSFLFRSLFFLLISSHIVHSFFIIFAFFLPSFSLSFRIFLPSQTLLLSPHSMLPFLSSQYPLPSLFPSFLPPPLPYIISSPIILLFFLQNTP